MERLTALALAGALGTLGLLSLEGQRRVGRWLGRVVWLLRTEAARTTMINIATCFPEWDDARRRRLARESLEHTGMLAAELGGIYRWSERRWRALAVSVDGDERLETAVAEQRGVLVLVPHFGNWEYLALVLGSYGLTALYDPPRIRALEPVMRAARSRSGASLVPIDAAGLRAFYRAFDAGEVTALLPDQVPDRRAGVYADFFGRPALTMTFVHRLLQRSDAAVLLGSARRCRGGFSVRFQPLGDALRDPDPEVSAAAMNQAVEALVREEPAQYQWEYKRFKRPPPGDTDPYRNARAGT